ncbi:hypothetical protein EVA_22658, partial [gut metagenome]
DISGFGGGLNAGIKEKVFHLLLDTTKMVDY